MLLFFAYFRLKLQLADTLIDTKVCFPTFEYIAMSPRARKVSFTLEIGSSVMNETMPAAGLLHLKPAFWRVSQSRCALFCIVNMREGSLLTASMI